MTGRLVNGLVLVVVGAILLMNTTGYLPWTVWDAAFTYWPVLVIGLGLQIVLSKWQIPLLALSIVIILILGAMNPYGGWGGSWYRSNGRRGIEFKFPRPWKPMENSRDWTVPLKPSVSKLELELKAPSLELEARGNPSLNEKSSPEALSAHISWDRNEPSTTSRDSEDQVRACIEAPDLSGSEAGKQVWAVDLNPSLSTSVNVSAGVANVTLDCESVFLQDINIAAGVASLDLKIGLTGKDTRVNVAGGAASVSIKVPSSAGLRVTVSGPLTLTHDFTEQGLTRSGSAWATPGFDSASTKVDVVVNCGAGTVKVDRSE